MYVNLIIRKEKYTLGRFWFYLEGFWGEAELFLGIWGAKVKYFQAAEIWGDQCIILWSRGAQNSPGDLIICVRVG